MGTAGKKIFKGHTLYWSEDRNAETGVFLTARGIIVFWNCVPAAIPKPVEEFEKYNDIDELRLAKRLDRGGPKPAHKRRDSAGVHRADQ